MDVSIFHSESIICKLYVQIEVSPVNQITRLLVSFLHENFWYSESRSPPWAKHDDSVGTCEQIKLIILVSSFKTAKAPKKIRLKFSFQKTQMNHNESVWNQSCGMKTGRYMPLPCADLPFPSAIKLCELSSGFAIQKLQQWKISTVCQIQAA